MARNVKEKVSVSIDPDLLGWADWLVETGVYENRSVTVEASLMALMQARAEVQFEEALASCGDEELAEGLALAEAGVEQWAAELDAIDGGYGSEGVKHATR